MKLYASALIFFAIIFSACINSKKSNFNPVPGGEDYKIQEKVYAFEKIVENKGGYGAENIPGWLAAYINGGIEEVERMSLYGSKYVFIGENGSGNFGALSKWAGNYSLTQDFSRLAAARIENRMVTAATLYPDDEYGVFFELMVKKAYNAGYNGASLEDTYWIKLKADQDEQDEMNVSEVYDFFVFISIDKKIMQNIIMQMMTDVQAAVTVSRAQNNAINRLQQTFFEGF